MDIHALRMFLAVAEDLHFSRAAERLHLAQPHVSRTIRALEDELGAELFRRSTRQVALTRAGAALVEPARGMLAAEDNARAVVTAAQNGRSGRVRISFAGPSEQVAIGELARQVREQHPLVDLDFRPGRYGISALEDVRACEADLAVARFARPPSGVASRNIYQDRCVIAVPVDHRLAQVDKIRFADLRGEPFVAFPESHGSTLRSLLVSRCHEEGFLPTFVQTTPDSWISLALVAAGVGLHFTSASAAMQLATDDIRICEIDDPLPEISVYLIWREHDTDPALARVLRTSRHVMPGLADQDLAGTPPWEVTERT